MSDKQLEDVNRNIRDLAAKLDPHDAELWEFVCECGDAGCTERVGLPLGRFDELKESDGALLAPGHPQAGRD
jgi:hypothetical protein